ncbi:MAG: hypothetical protein RLY47_75 [Candidatus Parcubacteria bacterium]|jgi:hypothetical protein
MLDLIHRLRSRPLAYRRKVAFWSTVGITSVIALIWALSLSVRFDDVDTPSEDSQISGPFETFMRQVRTGFGSLKDSIDKKDI